LTCAGVRVSRLPESPSLLRAPPLSSRRPAQSADMLCNTALLDLHALRRLYAGRVSIHLYVCVCERECVCDFYDALRGLHAPCHCHHVPADRGGSLRAALLYNCRFQGHQLARISQNSMQRVLRTKYTRALTFENLCQAPQRPRQARSKAATQARCPRLHSRRSHQEVASMGWKRSQRAFSP
jgi:hypothetical protein